MPAQSRYISKLAKISVLIIGGSSGLGYGVAEALIEYSASRIIISSSNADRVQKAISRLQSSYPDSKTKLQGVTCNLSDRENLEGNIKKLFESLELDGGKLDHVVFTAGDSLAQKPIGEVDLDFIIKAGMVRFYSPMLVAKHAVKYLNPGPASSITLTTGAVFQKPIPNWTVVGSYAGGLDAMARQLSLDLKPIRVNVVSPGGVKTELWDGMPEDKRQALFDSFSHMTTTGTVGHVEDVVEGYLWSMKDKNVTGTCISSNGGQLIASDR
jgi:NAD(P)-dependent dehydrogenase (short-subunit alcohol dehydrogenase family)